MLNFYRIEIKEIALKMPVKYIYLYKKIIKAYYLIA